MILGIDFGATTTDFALMQKGKIKKLFSAGQIAPVAISKAIPKILREKKIELSLIKSIVVTGGRSSRIKKLLGMKPVHVDEINAIGFGALFLAKNK